MSGSIASHGPVGRRIRRGQAGISLPEVLVYVGVSGIVLGILTLALRNMNTGFVSGAKTVRLQQDAREAINIMGRELRNAGLKRGVYLDGSGRAVDEMVEDAYMPGADSSSFLPMDGGRYDAIAFRQARLAADGEPEGVDTVTYSVDPNRQMLRRKLNDGRFEDFCPNVDAMQFQYGLYAADGAFMVSRPPTAAYWSAAGAVSAAFTATRMLMSLPGGGVGSMQNLGAYFDIAEAGTYALEIAAAGDAGFVANGGEMSINILGPGGSALRSERFRPGRSLAIHRVEVTAPGASGCRLSLGLTAAGPAAVKVAYVRFGPVDQGRFTWVDDPPVDRRKAVRAVRIMLMAKAGGPGSGTPTGSYSIGNVVVGIQDNQPRRYFEEDIAIPNNGVF